MTLDPVEIRFLSQSRNSRSSVPSLAREMTRIALEAKRFLGYPEAWIEEWTPILTFKPERVSKGYFWGAFKASDPGRLVGFSELTAPNAEGIAGLENMWIQPDCHGLGLGRHLFDVLREKALELGSRQLEVWSDPNAVGFYRRMGFEPHGEHHSTVQGEPRVLPILRLSLTTKP